jgi:energy-coupling factor transporter ATP-binding protein EcfA2
MQLKNVRISHFRSIKELRIDFTQPCLALVGINESGKSNILRALRLLDPAQKVEPEDLRDPEHEEAPVAEGLVRFVFTPDKADRDAIYDNAKAHFVGVATATLVTREGQELTLRDLVDEIRELLADIKIPNGKPYRGLWQLDPKLKVPKNWVAATSSWPRSEALRDASGAERRIEAGTFVNTDDFTEVDPSWVEPATLAALGSLLMQAAQPRVEAELPEVVFWTYREEHLLPAKLDIDTFAASPQSCIPLRNMFELYGIEEGDIADRVRAARSKTNGLRNLLDSIAKKATAHLKRVWKGYKHVAVDLRENGAAIDCTVQDRSNSFAFSRRSDGFKRFVSFLFHVSAPAQARSKERKLYLFDEPDLSLHPSGVQHLREELLRIAKGNTVVFSTHSIFMIDRDRVDRHLIVEKNGEVTTATPAEGAVIANEEVIYKALDWSLFELLKPLNIILGALGKMNPTRKAFADVGLAHAQGVKDVPRVTEFLDLANRKYLAVTDADSVAKEKQKKFEGTGEWCCFTDLIHGTEARTGEDFVKVDALVTAMGHVRTSFPILAEPTSALFTSVGGRVTVIEKWVRDGGIVDKDDIRNAVSAVKQAVIDKLTPAHLEDEYAALVTAIQARVEALSA